MPPNQPLPRDLKIDLHKPKLIHQPRRAIPRLLIQTQIVALEEHRATRRGDRNIVVDGVLDRMIEAGRVDIARLGGYALAEGLDEAQELLAVEGERGAAACGGVRGVRHLRELLPREVVAVHGEGGGDRRRGGVVREVEGVDSVRHHARELGLAGAGDAADGYH